MERGATADQAVAANSLTHRQDMASTRAQAVRVDASGGPRARDVARLAAYEAILRGATADEAIAANNLMHPQDIADARDAATRVAAGGGPLAPALGRRRIISRMEQAFVAASGGPRAPASAIQIAPTDMRTQEEIARTAHLHRRGQQRGLDELPTMRLSLGETAGTEEQRRQARAFAPRLAEVERALRQGDWNAVRGGAYSLYDSAFADYEADRIIGADYNSIAEQLSIVFRRVPSDNVRISTTER
ncbi:hypothetical protein OH764_34090 (plasmid) [Burkholderia sp. M6-3]